MAIAAQCPSVRPAPIRLREGPPVPRRSHCGLPQFPVLSGIMQNRSHAHHSPELLAEPQRASDLVGLVGRPFQVLVQRLVLPKSRRIPLRQRPDQPLHSPFLWGLSRLIEIGGPASFTNPVLSERGILSYDP